MSEDRPLRNVTNTQKEAENHPESFLADALIRSFAGDKNPGSSAILAQEARGQRELVNSDVLPIEGLTDDVVEYLTTQGFQFKEIVPNDSLFRYVIFPDGWKKVATDHSMHSDLVDPKDRLRAGIFYKAAFYDRHARIFMTRRFDISCNDYGEGRAKYKEGKPIIAFVVDRNKKIKFESRPIEIPVEQVGDRKIYKTWDARDIAEKEVKEWLDIHFPGWNDFRKYWDE